MSVAKKKEAGTSPSWKTRFWAVVQYELLWNIRKKKFIGMVIVAFVFSTLGLVLPVILSNSMGQSLEPNPDYAVSSSPGAFGFFLFALVTVMNSISGEFESGTIVPLLTKPVSRTMVFLGKLFAAFLTLLSVYAILYVYTTIGGAIVYGPQNNLHLVPLSLLGSIISTFVWIALVLAIGSISKSSLIAALTAFGIFFALLISSPIVSVFSDQAWILNYFPGSGATGTLASASSGQGLIPAKSVSTGTDNIAANLINFIFYPSANVNFSKISILQPGQPAAILYTESLSLILFRSIAIALAYIFAFSFIAWFGLKRAQVSE